MDKKTRAITIQNGLLDSILGLLGVVRMLTIHSPSEKHLKEGLRVQRAGVYFLVNPTTMITVSY